MYFNVSQLMREPTGATRDYTVDDEITLPLEGAARARVCGPVELIRTPRGLVARADLRLTATEPCSRCLAPAAIPMELRIDEEYLPTVDPITGGRLPEPDDPTAFRVDDHHHLDLTDAVHQAVLLAEPMQPLCRPDCRGLCPECGADLNTGPCACAPASVDARWQALRGLDVSP
jgi:uncharacterized protein